MARAVPVAVALLALSTTALDAQPRFIQAGDEVRLYVVGVISPFEGVLLGAGPETLTVATPEGAELTIRRDQIERSQVRGSRPNTILGAAVGGGLGLAAGLGLLITSKDDCTRDAAGFCVLGDNFDEWLLFVPPLAGAGIGALIGSVVRSGRWLPAFLPREAGNGDVALELTWSVPFGS